MQSATGRPFPPDVFRLSAPSVFQDLIRKINAGFNKYVVQETNSLRARHLWVWCQSAGKGAFFLLGWRVPRTLRTLQLCPGGRAIFSWLRLLAPGSACHEEGFPSGWLSFRRSGNCPHRFVGPQNGVSVGAKVGHEQGCWTPVFSPDGPDYCQAYPGL